jgi:hypothetical protein
MGLARFLPLVLASFAASSGPAPEETRATFPYHQADYLYPGEGPGGLAYVPREAPEGAAVPLVVFLHGVNTGPVVHPWLGSRGLPDLTTKVGDLVHKRSVRPFILAAPTQTRGAMAGKRMWDSFDLDEFVSAVDASLGHRAHVARDEVVVIGHSGAGCNPDGGILRVAVRPGRIVPFAIVAIDTCLDEESGAALGSAGENTAIFVEWQQAIWPRSISLFMNAYHASARVTGKEDPIVWVEKDLGANPHEEIVFRAFGELLPSLFHVTNGVR